MDQLEGNPEHETSSTLQADPLPAVATQSNKVIERARHAMEQRWETHQDNGDDGEGCIDENDKDKDDTDNEDIGDDEDNKDNGDNKNNEDNKNNDKDGDNEHKNEIPGLSTWDLFCEDFKCEHQETVTIL